MNSLDDLMPRTSHLLGHPIDPHDSTWIEFCLQVLGNAISMRVDWAVLCYDNRNCVRTTVEFTGISRIDMPPKWDSIYDWDFESQGQNRFSLRMTENHRGKPIEIAFVNIEELSAELISFSDLAELTRDHYAPRGRILLESSS